MTGLAKVHLTKTLVLLALEDHKREEGSYPHPNSGKILHTDMGNPDCTWSNVDTHLRRKLVEGVDKKSSLTRFLADELEYVTSHGSKRSLRILKTDDLLMTLLAEMRETKKRIENKFTGPIANGPLAGVMAWGGVTNSMHEARKIEPALQPFSLRKLVAIALDQMAAQGAKLKPATGASRGKDSVIVPADFDKEKFLIGAKARMQQEAAPEISSAPQITAREVYTALIKGSFTKAALHNPATPIGSHTVEQINRSIAGKAFSGAAAYMGTDDPASVYDFAKNAGGVAPEESVREMSHVLTPRSTFAARKL